ncbi:hypothetical protein YC2023_058434 [Brassica napus]
MISFDWKLPEIVLMSVKLLNRTLSVEKNSKVSAIQSVDRIVMASAIKGELKLSTIDL